MDFLKLNKALSCFYRIFYKLASAVKQPEINFKALENFFPRNQTMEQNPLLCKQYQKTTDPTEAINKRKMHLHSIPNNLDYF